jgi:hypothetical protein
MIGDERSVESSLAKDSRSLITATRVSTSRSIINFFVDYAFTIFEGLQEYFRNSL